MKSAARNSVVRSAMIEGGLVQNQVVSSQVDTRPESVAQKKLQEMANNSRQTQCAMQLRSLADSSPTNVAQGKFEDGGTIKAEWKTHKNYPRAEKTLLEWSKDEATHTDLEVGALLEQTGLVASLSENRYWSMPVIRALSVQEQQAIWLQLSPLNKLELFYQWALAEILGAPIEVAAFVGTAAPQLAIASGKIFYDEMQRLAIFVRAHNYGMAFHLTEDALFGHKIISLYPKQKSDDEIGKQGSGRKVVHRPMLDIEIIDNRLYARCYLGMFKKGTDSGHKDVQADDAGKVTLQNIGLMNLGNPFKAMLWCEDYLQNQEHVGSVAPSPVVRSFLVPLADADMMLKQENDVRPLDQDRGAGQFGSSTGKYIYDTILHPLAGSLVSFFAEYKDYSEEVAKKNQAVLPMTALQERLTGHSGDLRSMTTKGIAAQHGRKEHKAHFAPGYVDALTAYTQSITGTGFSDATKGSAAVPGKYSGKEFDLSKFPKVASTGSSYSGDMPEEISKSMAMWYQFRQKLGKVKKAEPVKKSVESGNTGSVEPGSPEKVSEGGKESADLSMMEALDEAVIIQRNWFNITPNNGGGDCLYHALEGSNIDDIAAYRLAFAQNRRTMPDSVPQGNRNSHEMRASLSATLGNRVAGEMMEGRDSINNAMYAQMLELPGVYAGPAEIDQWCATSGRNVIVIDSAHQDVLRHRPNAANEVLLNLRTDPQNIQQLRAIVGSGDIILFKSWNHYERVTAISGDFPH